MRIDVVPYDHPDAARLIAEVQQEYEVRYGSQDSAPVNPAEFSAPRGLFLVGYLVYHAHVGERSTHFTATGIIRPIYFTMLISHILLAFVTLPLVIVTLVPVFRRRWDRHRRIARWTMPIWLYVSVTGVLVYLMLYKWFPAPNLALGQ